MPMLHQYVNPSSIPEAGELRPARLADGRIERLARLAAELAALKPAVIVAYGPHATQAALAANPDSPVVAINLKPPKHSA